MAISQLIRDTEAAEGAVREILSLLRENTVEQIIAFDVETMPIEGLTEYPGTVLDDNDERIDPTKKQYRQYIQRIWYENCSPERLAQYRLHVPDKLNGSTATAQWKMFYSRVLELKQEGKLQEALKGSHWLVDQARGLQAELDAKIAKLEADKDELIRNNKRGVKGKCAVIDAQIAELQVQRSRVPAVLERAQRMLDWRLLSHVVFVAEEGQIKVDLVRPGLDPHTSDIFSTQITLRRRADGELLTWVFNNARVPVERLLPVFSVKKVSCIWPITPSSTLRC